MKSYKNLLCVANDVDEVVFSTQEAVDLPGNGGRAFSGVYAAYQGMLMQHHIFHMDSIESSRTLVFTSLKKMMFALTCSLHERIQITALQPAFSTRSMLRQICRVQTSPHEISSRSLPQASPHSTTHTSSPSNTTPPSGDRCHGYLPQRRHNRCHGPLPTYASLDSPAGHHTLLPRTSPTRYTLPPGSTTTDRAFPQPWERVHGPRDARAVRHADLQADA
jgi:hypothetical protein